MADEHGEPSTLVASIDDDATGRWQITTETGSTYVVDLDQRVITRVPELRALRRDHEPLLLHCVLEARVGDSGRFLVQVRPDDVPTLRLTSHIVGLVQLRSRGSSRTRVLSCTEAECRAAFADPSGSLEAAGDGALAIRRLQLLGCRPWPAVSHRSSLRRFSGSRTARPTATLPIRAARRPGP